MRTLFQHQPITAVASCTVNCDWIFCKEWFDRLWPQIGLRYFFALPVIFVFVMTVMMTSALSERTASFLMEIIVNDRDSTFVQLYHNKTIIATHFDHWFSSDYRTGCLK